MFDLTSSKLLILGLVALIVVGPKDLPLLLRTIGKYVGLIRRHANDFRAQFDEAMRDQELTNLKAEMEAVKRDVENTIHDTHQAVTAHMTAVTDDIALHIQNPQPKDGPVNGTSASAAVGSAHETAIMPPEPAAVSPHATVHADADPTLLTDGTAHAPKAGA